MHKSRAHAVAAEFFITLLVWGVLLVVLLHLASSTSHPNQFLSSTATWTASAEEKAGLGASTLSVQQPAPQTTHDTYTAVKAQTRDLFKTLSVALRPRTYAGSQLVVVTSATSPYLDWTFNWSKHLARLGVNHAVVALDSLSASTLATHSVPAVLDASTLAAQLGLKTHSSVRKDFAQLRHLGYLRIGLPLHLMQQYQWQSMVLSDADVAWLRHPEQLLQLYPDADLLVSTDCLSVKAVAQAQVDTPRCGMQPGGWNSAWNSGTVLVRNTSAAVQAVTAWRDLMAPGSVSKSVEGWWIDDQLALTRLLDSDSMPFEGLGSQTTNVQSLETQLTIEEPTPAQRMTSAVSVGSANNSLVTQAQTMWAWKRQVKVVALPPLVIAGGHVALHQHLPEQYNVTPFAVHFTFQAHYDNAGKLSRARESGLWVMDVDDPEDTRYTTYSNMVGSWLQEVELAWQQQTGRPLVNLHKHLLAAAFQLQVLADALAAAHVLDRTLVPPRMVCYCTQDSSAWTDVLKTCAIEGSDQLPPFDCTLENFVNVVELQRDYGLALKTPNHLSRAEVRARIQDTTVRIQFAADATLSTSVVPDYTAELLTKMRGASRTSADSSRVVLPLRVTDADLQRALRHHATATVLDLGPIAPNWFAVLNDTDAAAAVQKMVDRLTAYVGWCCLLLSEPGQNMTHAFSAFQKPTVTVAQGVDTAEHVLAGGTYPSNESTGESSLSETPEMRSPPLGAQHDAADASRGWMPADTLFDLPDWCNQEYLGALNWNVSSRSQHPCTYLRPGMSTQQSSLWRQQMKHALQRLDRYRLLDASGDVVVAGSYAAEASV